MIIKKPNNIPLLLVVAVFVISFDIAAWNELSHKRSKPCVEINALTHAGILIDTSNGYPSNACK